MSDEKPSKVSTIINILAALVTVCSVVFGGGVIYQKAVTAESRITSVDVVGSSAFIRHQAMDDEREKSLAARVNTVESAILTLQDLKADLREIKAELRSMKPSTFSH